MPSTNRPRVVRVGATSRRRPGPEARSSVTPNAQDAQQSGRAEAIRLTFAEKEVSYEEKNFTGEAWGKTSSTGLKANFTAAGQLAFGQVPMLEVDGLHVVQSHSILRFAARKYKWYEAYTAEELMRIDVAADGTEVWAEQGTPYSWEMA